MNKKKDMLECYVEDSGSTLDAIFFKKVWHSELSESLFDIFKIFSPSKGYYMLAYNGMILNYFSNFYMLQLGTL